VGNANFTAFQNQCLGSFFLLHNNRLHKIAPEKPSAG